MTALQNSTNPQYSSNGRSDRRSFQNHHAHSERTFREFHVGNTVMEATEKEPFEEHDKRVRVFRQSHSSVFGVRATAGEKPALLKSVGGFSVNQAVADTGGSKLPIDTVEWIPFIPGCRILKRRFSQN